jgi:RNA polymerase sigma factor (sigma-70 family)
MATRQLAPVLRYIRRVSRAASADDSDRTLLQRFVRHGDAEAFAHLVRRHGPMVLGVCRRVLRDGHDADDAFQGVFLLLVRKAGSLRRPEQLGPWLHGVAHRVAVKARGLGLRRSRCEEPLPDLPAPPSADDLIWRDLRPVLDDAVRSLPLKYRGPFVLCYLQGMTHAEAARHLGCPPGTIATRLSRARDQLRARLLRRGVTLSAGALAAALATRAEAAVPPALLGNLAPSAVISSHVTALTEGVCKAMLMEKLRFVVMALVAAVAAGAIVMGYRSGAAEPPSAENHPAFQSVAPPIAGVISDFATAAKEDGSAIILTKNFEIKAPSRRIGLLFAEAAERHRKDQALTWLRKELPRWPERCKLEVKVTTDGAGGATTFEFADGKVKSRHMHLEGSLDRLLASALPHEITHIVFADYFGKPVVRWADEGGAVLSEDQDDQQRHEKLARTIMVETPGRAIPLRRLAAMKDFPTDVMSLYAEGYSVTHFLVGKKDNKTFLAFVKQGMDDGWDKAVKESYGFKDLEALEDAWLADLRRRATKAEPRPLPPAPAPKGDDEGIAIPPSMPPVTGLAVIDKEGRLRLQELETVYVPVAQPTQGGARGSDDTAAFVGRAAVKLTHVLDPAKTSVYAMDGKRIDPEKLPDLLRKETPVLISTDGKMVHPFHLQLIKEGTLIVVKPVVHRG